MARRKNLATDNNLVINRALSMLHAEFGSGVVEEIRPILHANFREGRVVPFLNSRQGDLLHYIRRVARYYLQEHSRLVDLQVRRDPEAWCHLAARLQSWALAYLRQTAPSAESLPELATAASNQCAHQILQKRFPYDLSFQVWTMFLMQQSCRDVIGER